MQRKKNLIITISSFAIMIILGIILIISMPVANTSAMALTSIQHPERGTIDASLGITTNVKYIPNAEYFRSSPIYGKNVKDESIPEDCCGAVAAQMLLNYQNYYCDRRIIDNGDLFTGEDNPNQCADPTLMTSKTLGSVSWDESYYTLNTKYKASGYFDKVLDYVGRGGTILWQIKKGLEDIIADRKKDVGGDFGFNTVYHLEKLGTTAVAPEEIRQYIDAGHPVILEMTKPLGGINHFVVAYGYEDLKSSATNHESSFGYIVNYGWGSDGDHAWVSSSWVNGYALLRSNHKHDYTQYVGGSYAEYKCGCGHRISAYETEELLNGDLKITGLKKPISGSVAIPATLNNKAITEIGDGAFKNQTEITFLSTATSATSIGDNAFAYCTKLTTVNLNTGTNYIGDNAFYYSGLTTIRIPRSVVTIGNSAFEYCKNLQAIYFDTWGNATTIGENAFANCYELSYVSDMSSQINEIKKYTFKGDSKLKQVTFDKRASKINSINEYAFAYCSALTTINLPNSVKNIYQYAFYCCSSLTTFNLNNVTTLYLGAFDNCTKLTSFSVESSNTTLTIDDDRAVYKGNSIIAYAPGNTNEEYTLKTNTTRIEEGAFKSANKLTSVILPVNLTYIGQYAFDGCAGLKSIVIHQNCAQICAYAFNYCYFNSVTMYSTGNIQFGVGAFKELPATSKIYVPNSRLSYYRNADNLDVADDNIQPIMFKLTLDKNDGTAETAQYVYYGEAVQLPTNTTKVGYGLEGWYRSETNNNGSGTKFASGSMYTDKGNITLYAKWVAKADGNVKFDSNGGEGSMNDLKVKYNQTVTIPTATFTRHGYDFVGWAEDPNGAVVYKAGTSYKFALDENSTTTLYAKWEAHKYKITYNGNNKSIDTGSFPTYYTIAKTVNLPKASSPGYTFYGWSYDTYYILTDTAGYAQDLNLKAEWTVTYAMVSTASTYITDVSMILDFAGYSWAQSVNKQFTISDKAAALTIKNANNLYDLYFVVETGRPTDMDIILDNAKFTGREGKSAIYAHASTVNLYCNRNSTIIGGTQMTNSITGPDATFDQSGSAITCVVLNIRTYAGGGTLTLQGGAGKNGSAGKSGTNGGNDTAGTNGEDGEDGIRGGCGVVAGQVFIYSTQPIYIYGGNGGRGGNGGSGGNSGALTGTPDHGKVGATGLKGGNGGNGGRGGMQGVAVFSFFKSDFVEGTKVYLRNGIPGDGGNGGRGGMGGRGQKGGPGKFGTPAAKGGTGGTGGDGGKGGDVCLPYTEQILTLAVLSGTKHYTPLEPSRNYGIVGQGGAGGTGGTGGEGGNKWPTNNLADSGARGATGVSGTAGIEKSQSK